MKPFEYFSPATLAEAISLLSQCGDDPSTGAQGRALAGGTDLLIRMKRRQWTPRAVVSL
ncbi:MAG: FAD binding domain-containing protein, partial [Chloroflexota bacterium]|nr:FAD binding domain-containing protein [Chloroflexota bacterium]